jgi:hypothetical protein
VSVVYKYPFAIQDRVTVRLPRNADILHIGEQQFGELCVWALVDPDAPPTVERYFRVFGTGHAVPDDVELDHLTTIISANGLVWHIFEDDT